MCYKQQEIVYTWNNNEINNLLLVRCINFTAYWMCKYFSYLFVVGGVAFSAYFHRRHSGEFLHAPASPKKRLSFCVDVCAVLAGRAGSAQGRPWLLLLALSFRDVYPSLAQWSALYLISGQVFSTRDFTGHRSIAFTFRVNAYILYLMFPIPGFYDRQLLRLLFYVCLL